MGTDKNKKNKKVLLFKFSFFCSWENHIKTRNVITLDVCEHNSRYDNVRMKN